MQRFRTTTDPMSYTATGDRHAVPAPLLAGLADTIRRCRAMQTKVDRYR